MRRDTSNEPPSLDAAVRRPSGNTVDPSTTTKPSLSLEERLFSTTYATVFDNPCQSAPPDVAALRMRSAEDLVEQQPCPPLIPLPSALASSSEPPSPTFYDGVLRVGRGSPVTHWQPLLPVNFTAILDARYKAMAGSLSHLKHDSWWPTPLVTLPWFVVPSSGADINVLGEVHGMLANMTLGSALKGLLRTGGECEGVRLGDAESVAGGRQLDVLLDVHVAVPVERSSSRRKRRPWEGTKRSSLHDNGKEGSMGKLGHTPPTDASATKHYPYRPLKLYALVLESVTRAAFHKYAPKTSRLLRELWRHGGQTNDTVTSSVDNNDNGNSVNNDAKKDISLTNNHEAYVFGGFHTAASGSTAPNLTPAFTGLPYRMQFGTVMCNGTKNPVPLERWFWQRLRADAGFTTMYSNDIGNTLFGCWSDDVQDMFDHVPPTRLLHMGKLLGKWDSPFLQCNGTRRTHEHVLVRFCETHPPFVVTATLRAVSPYTLRTLVVQWFVLPTSDRT